MTLSFFSCAIAAKSVDSFWPQQQLQRDVQEVVAAGALDRPVFAQELAGLEDLLGDDPGLRCTLAQANEVLQRIAQSVGVVDTNAVEHAALQPVEDEGVRLFEDMLALDAQADQRIDVEEAAVAELLVRGLPVGKPVALLVKEVVEAVLVRVQLRDGALDRLAGVGLLDAQPAQQAVEHGLIAVTGHDQPAVPELGHGQAAVRGGEKAQRVGLGILRRPHQDRGERWWGDGKLLVGGAHEKPAPVALHLDAA